MVNIDCLGICPFCIRNSFVVDLRSGFYEQDFVHIWHGDGLLSLSFYHQFVGGFFTFKVIGYMGKEFLNSFTCKVLSRSRQILL